MTYQGMAFSDIPKVKQLTDTEYEAIKYRRLVITKDLNTLSKKVLQRDVKEFFKLHKNIRMKWKRKACYNMKLPYHILKKYILAEKLGEPIGN